MQNRKLSVKFQRLDSSGLERFNSLTPDIIPIVSETHGRVFFHVIKQSYVNQILNIKLIG